MTAPAINLDQARTARRRRAYQPVDRTPAEKEDRERRKRLWLDRIDADLPTEESRSAARVFHVSLRLLRQVTGLIVNLDSFLDRGLVYASQAGLADHIKNANERPMSDRQVRRAVAFLEARGHLRVERTRGTRNQMYPLYRVPGATVEGRATDTMSADHGPHVLAFEAHVLRKQESKLLEQSQKEPPLPPVAPVKPIANGGNSDQPIVTRTGKESGLARKQVAQPMTDAEVETPEFDAEVETPEFKAQKAEYIKWYLAPFDPLAPEPSWYPSEADPEQGKIGPPDFATWHRRITRPIEGAHETIAVEIAAALAVPVPFNELWALIRRGNRGAAMGAYLKLKPEQTYEARRQLAYQLEDGPLPDDFPVAATVFNMIARGQSVRIATAAIPTTPKQVLVLEGTDDWDEWQSHLRETTGRGSPVSKAGGWYFPSRRPCALSTCEFSNGVT
jgi:hypothetical protein